MRLSDRVQSLIPRTHLAAAAAEAPARSVATQLDELIRDAWEQGASDLHLLPGGSEVEARVRVDGALLPFLHIAHSEFQPILARLKVLADLRTDERFQPQDGRFTFMLPDGAVLDVRLSLAPAHHGESAVLRLLPSSAKARSFGDLGMRNAHQLLARRALERPYGLLLATGPTGSGKTTLLYTLLRELSTGTRSIVTLEDPIEYALPGVTQIPVHAGRGMTFSKGLRSILRQDPDVLLVGEVRDAETAQLSVNAALTGHLVLSSLHANDAPSAVPRLLDLGVEPYLLASTLDLVVSQRLVRRICPDCCEEHRPEERLLERIRPLVHEALPGSDTFHRGRGCETCRGTGYRGRIGVFEILRMDEPLRDAVFERASASMLRDRARSLGMRTLLEDGLKKARKGITSIEEIARLSYV